jgi:hypothetical protein
MRIVMASRRRTDPKILLLLDGLPEAVQDLVEAARALVLKVLPDVQESIDRRARLLGYALGSGYAGTICVLMPNRSGVNLGFYRANELPDPRRLLQGSGGLHRHVKLQSAKDLRKAGLRPLLRAAGKACRVRLEAAAAAGTKRLRQQSLWR